MPNDQVYIEKPREFLVVEQQAPREIVVENLYIETPRDYLIISDETQVTLVIEERPVQGPAGVPPLRATYAHSNVSVSNNTITLDANSYASFLVNVTSNINTIEIVGWPTNTYSQHLSVYFKQDSTGHHNITGWPAAVVWGDTVEPVFSDQQANDVGHVILNSFDAGNTIFATTIAYKYE